MKNSFKKEKGIALLIVVLVGAIMILTSIALGQYTLRLLKSTQARSDAVQDLYNAEGSFECVKYWLHKDYRNFSNIGGFSTDSVCNGTHFNFSTGTGGASYVLSGVIGIGTFNIPNNTGGSIKVEVERDATQNLFDGNVRVYSQSNSATTDKNEERYQKYKYRLLHGADIMFVVDRSGSITGDRADRSANDEWNSMLDAVNASIRVLAQNVPAPYIGLLSFGTDPSDTGQQHACPGGYSNCRIPDVPLTDTSSGVGALIDDKSTFTRDDDTPNMNTAVAATNLSLGISIAGAELMGKYYPDDGVGGNSGVFEKIVADDLSFNSLPTNSSSNDRPDAQYRDVIVVVTDGAPNGIITHIDGSTPGQDWYRSSVLSSPYNFINPVAHSYQLGEVKLFRTPSNGSGSMIVDNNDGASLPVASLYRYCNDKKNTQPSGVLSVPNKTNLFDTGNPATRYRARMPMCNATLIANKLKKPGIDITFIAVYVYGNGLTEAQARATPEAQWLAKDFVSSHNGQPLLGLIKRENYDQLMDTIMALFEQLDIVESR